MLNALKYSNTAWDTQRRGFSFVRGKGEYESFGWGTLNPLCIVWVSRVCKVWANEVIPVRRAIFFFPFNAGPFVVRGGAEVGDLIYRKISLKDSIHIWLHETVRVMCHLSRRHSHEVAETLFYFGWWQVRQTERVLQSFTNLGFLITVILPKRLVSSNFLGSIL